MPLPSAHDVALAAERRAAARLLPAHPLVTSNGPHSDTFPLIRLVLPPPVRDREHVLHWTAWRRRHQAVATACHQQRHRRHDQP